jgi:hypothetical protein
MACFAMTKFDQENGMPRRIGSSWIRQLTFFWKILEKFDQFYALFISNYL